MPLLWIVDDPLGVAAKKFHAFVRIENTQLVKGLQNLIDANVLGKAHFAIGCRHQRAGRHHPFQERTITLPVQPLLKQIGQGRDDTTHRSHPL